MRIKTCDFPKLKLTRRPYAAIRRYFDSIKPWQSKYNPDNERPIGQRACKLTSDGQNFHNSYSSSAEDRAADRDGARFNKAMRMLRDESIAFRLYDTDCVTYHPDNSITVHGFASVSTNDFIRALTPAGIHHGCRHEMYDGRRGSAFEPVLHLHPTIEHVEPPSAWRDEELRWTGPDWSRGMIVNCDGPVKLHYNVAHGHFVPSEPEQLEPFQTYQVDRRAARAVSREYHLRRLQLVLDAVIALTQQLPDWHGRTWAPGSAKMGEIMDALKAERYRDAIALMPRGTSRSFGRTHGTSNGIEPGFMRRLRNHIYDHEGLIERVSMPILTPAQYERYKVDGKQFDA